MLLLAQLPVFAVPTGTPNFTNLVVFVRANDDLGDDFNALPLPDAKPKRTTWTRVKEEFNCTITTNSDSAYTSTTDGSFCEYIRRVTDGAIEVENIFPQDYTENETAKISYLALNRETSYYYDSGSYMLDGDKLISEVIAAFSNGTLSLPAGTKLDRREAGVIDNLTIVFHQQDGYGGMKSYHTSSSDGTGIRGCLVRHYNVLAGDTLVSDSAGLVSHEFLHTLGLPDLYRYNTGGTPVGAWDIMSSESPFLQFLLAYQRKAMGWISLSEITATGEYYLSSPLDGNSNLGYIIRSPLSSTEFFVVEYRRKNEDMSGFEHRIPESGVIVYRVNTSYDTNSGGNDYIYVFRDGETGLTDSYSTDSVVTSAALSAGESRGSSDLTKTYSDNTIFFSDGSNSGIVVTADGVQPDGRMKISVSYPDLSSLSLWDKLGDTLATGGAEGNACAFDASGNLYALYSEAVDDGLYYRAYVKKWNGSAWSLVGGAVGDTNGQNATLEIYNDTVYVSFGERGTAQNTVIKRFSGGAWSEVGRFSVQTTSNAKLASSPSGLYALVTTKNNELSLYKSNAAGTAFSYLNKISGQSSNMSTPALSYYDGRAIVVSCDFFLSGAPTLVESYDEATNSWTELGRFGHMHTLKAVSDENGLFVTLKPQDPIGSAAAVATIIKYDGTTWTDYPSFSAASGYNNLSIELNGGSPVVMATPDEIAQVYTLESNVFTKLGFDIRNGISSADLALNDNKAYVVTTDKSGQVNVYYKALSGVTVSVTGADTLLINDSLQLSAVVTPTSAAESGVTWSVTNGTGTATITQGGLLTSTAAGTVTVRATAKDGSGIYGEKTVTVYSYDIVVEPDPTSSDGKLYIDGVPYSLSALASGSVATAADGNAQTAVMYKYNASGIPTGMTVWALSFSGGKYTAEKVPALEDILTYHGFSVRITGAAGIRFKTGVSTSTRASLLSTSGLNGYKLVEYCTLVMYKTDLDSFPFIKDGTSVKSGRAYWKQNGKVYDSIFETAGGRYRYTSVLVNIAPQNYKTEYAFRGYVILQKGGVNYTLYGPILFRSIYDVSGQVLSLNIYDEGSAEYTYLTNLRETADAL